MSELPRFRGRKAQIVERLRLGESRGAIAAALHTSGGYVDNVRSLLKRKYRIVFTPPQIRPQETQGSDVVNAAPPTIQQAAPGAVNPAREPQISNIETVTTPPIKAPETTSVNPELEALQRDVNRIHSRVSEKQEILILKQKKQELLRREDRLSIEAQLQGIVFDICPDIREMWNNRAVYIQVMTGIFQTEHYRAIFDNLAGIRAWSYEQAEHRFPLVLEQIFDNTSPAFKTGRLASETILTDSIVEFIDYFDLHPRCPKDQMPGLPTGGPGAWGCAEGHVWCPS
jgi:hypothetical protein